MLDGPDYLYFIVLHIYSSTFCWRNSFIRCLSWHGLANRSLCLSCMLILRPVLFVAQVFQEIDWRTRLSLPSTFPSVSIKQTNKQKLLLPWLHCICISSTVYTSVYELFLGVRMRIWDGTWQCRANVGAACRGHCICCPVLPSLFWALGNEPTLSTTELGLYHWAMAPVPCYSTSEQYFVFHEDDKQFDAHFFFDSNIKFSMTLP